MLTTDTVCFLIYQLSGMLCPPHQDLVGLYGYGHLKLLSFQTAGCSVSPHKHIITYFAICHLHPC